MKLNSFMKKKIFSILMYFFFIIHIYADNGITFYFIPDERLVIKERQNIRINEYYDFDKGQNHYLGYSFREIKGILSLSVMGTEVFGLSGNYYVFQTLKRNDILIAKMIEDIIPVSFNIYRNGTYEVSDNYVFPNVQSFPVFPAESVEPGDVWTGYGIRIVDPDNDGNYTRVQFLCEYSYIGPDFYENRTVHYITAQYAMRYSQGDDPYGDPNLVEISGKHLVTIRMTGNGQSIELITDIMDEQYNFVNSRKLELTGSILTFFKGTEPLDKPDTLKNLLQKFGEKAGENTNNYFDEIPDDEFLEEIKDNELIEELEIELDEHPSGVILTLNNIHFLENSAVILPEEESRLDIIAEGLLNVPERTFLVIGHTTNIGTEEFLYNLSVERAKAIVDSLIERGIPPGRLLYEGRGGTEPLAPNDSEEHKTINRRVEVIILED